MAEINNIDGIHFDVLREIGNIGAGNATTALSKMLNARIDMQVPKVEMLGFKELHENIGGAENLVAAILLNLDGDISGMIMFIVETKAAKSMVKLLMGDYASEGETFTEMEQSALCEIGNIITGAYVSSLASLTNMFINPSIPYLSIDMAGAILSVPAIEFGMVSDNALLIETEFGELGEMINGYFILIPTLESYDAILKSLGM